MTGAREEQKKAADAMQPLPTVHQLEMDLSRIYHKVLGGANPYNLGTHAINDFREAIETLFYILRNIVRDKKHLTDGCIFAGNNVPMHLENHPQGENRCESLTRSLLMPFIAAFDNLDRMGPRFVKRFCEKLDGNCIDARTRSAFDYGLSARISFGDRIEDITFGLPRGLRDKYFSCMSMMLTDNNWGLYFDTDIGINWRKTNGYITEEVIFDEKGVSNYLHLGKNVENDFLDAYARVPAARLSIFFQIILKEEDFIEELSFTPAEQHRYDQLIFSTAVPPKRTLLDEALESKEYANRIENLLHAASPQILVELCQSEKFNAILRHFGTYKTIEILFNIFHTKRLHQSLLEVLILSRFLDRLTPTDFDLLQERTFSEDFNLMPLFIAHCVSVYDLAEKLLQRENDILIAAFLQHVATTFPPNRFVDLYLWVQQKCALDRFTRILRQVKFIEKPCYPENIDWLLPVDLIENLKVDPAQITALSNDQLQQVFRDANNDIYLAKSWCYLTALQQNLLADVLDEERLFNVLEQQENPRDELNNAIEALNNTITESKGDTTSASLVLKQICDYSAPKATKENILYVTELAHRTAVGVRNPENEGNLRRYPVVAKKISERSCGRKIAVAALCFFCVVLFAAAISTACITGGVSVGLAALVGIKALEVVATGVAVTSTLGLGSVVSAGVATYAWKRPPNYHTTQASRLFYNKTADQYRTLDDTAPPVTCSSGWRVFRH